MKTKILLLILALATVAALAQLNISNPFFVAGVLKPSGGDGPNVWYDVSTTSDSEEAGDPNFYQSEVVTIGQAGTATKARIEIHGFSSSTDIKMALYSEADNSLLANGVATALGTGYLEITFGTPVAVSATTYRLAYESSGTGCALGYLATAGSTYRYHSLAYASFPENPRSSGTSFGSRTLKMGVYVD